MKICPLCNTQYPDDKNLCDKDACPLQPKIEEEDKKKVPFDPKRLFNAIVWTVGFVIFMIILYYVLGTVR